MSIDQAQVVDAVGLDPLSGEVVLTISDHLDWSDVENHIVLLQEKLNAYLAFVESGEIVESYPKAIGRKARIDLITKFEIVRDAQATIARMSEILRGAGIEFRTAVLGVKDGGA